MSFFLIQDLNQHACSRSAIQVVGYLGCIQQAYLLNYATLAASNAEIEKSKQLEKCVMYLVQLNKSPCLLLAQAGNKQLASYLGIGSQVLRYILILSFSLSAVQLARQSIGSVRYTNWYQASHLATPNLTQQLVAFTSTKSLNDNFLIVYRYAATLQCFC